MIKEVDSLHHRNVEAGLLVEPSPKSAEVDLPGLLDDKTLLVSIAGLSSPALFLVQVHVNADLFFVICTTPSKSIHVEDPARTDLLLDRLRLPDGADESRLLLAIADGDIVLIDGL